MDKNFIIYIPGSELTQIHERTPWLMIPIAFKELGYNSTIICGKYSLKSRYDIDIYTTMPRSTSFLKSAFEPILAFRRIFSLKPDIVLISPFGSYLFSIIPLTLTYKLYAVLARQRKTKFIMKTDWSLEFTDSKRWKKLFSILLLSISSHTFDKISLETYCGLNKANSIPLIKKQNLTRVPVGFPENMDYDKIFNCRHYTNRIICVARVTPMKGQIVLLKAFLLLSTKYPKWQLRFVGPIEDVEYKNQLDSLILKGKIEDKVSFSGFIEENLLLKELGKASIFCLPSIYKESAGNVKYEALAAGLPVVTTDVPCKEDNEELGFLVSKAGDINALAKNLELLISDPLLRTKLVKNFRGKILSYKNLAELYISL